MFRGRPATNEYRKDIRAVFNMHHRRLHFHQHRHQKSTPKPWRSPSFPVRPGRPTMILNRFCRSMDPWWYGCRPIAMPSTRDLTFTNGAYQQQKVDRQTTRVGRVRRGGSWMLLHSKAKHAAQDPTKKCFVMCDAAFNTHTEKFFIHLLFFYFR